MGLLAWLSNWTARRPGPTATLRRTTPEIAHDFNNLLTVIIGALEQIERHPDDAPRRDRMVSAAKSAAERGERLAQEILAASRPPSTQPVQLDLWLQEAEPRLQRAAGDDRTLILALTAPDASAHLDVDRFEAAMLNLVANARDATAQGGLIRIETGKVRLTSGQVAALPEGDFLQITVQDDGAGMDPQTLQRAFEPHYTTKSLGKGSGLGLAQVHDLARDSRGAATAQSDEGKGTRINLYLPSVA